MWLLRFNLYRTYLLGISLCLPGTGLSDELLLLEAVEYNNVHVAEALLLDGADVNTRQADGATPLHWACLLYTSPSPRDGLLSRMPSSA